MNKPMISDERVAKFQALYKSRFGREIGRREALEKGIKLVRLMQLVVGSKQAESHENTGNNTAKIID